MDEATKHSKMDEVLRLLNHRAARSEDGEAPQEPLQHSFVRISAGPLKPEAEPLGTFVQRLQETFARASAASRDLVSDVVYGTEELHRSPDDAIRLILGDQNSPHAAPQLRCCLQKFVPSLCQWRPQYSIDSPNKAYQLYAWSVYAQAE